MKLPGTALGVCALMGLGLGCSSTQVRQAETLMGTVVEITAEGRDADLVQARVAAALAEIQRVDRLMSHYREDSEVSRINRGAGKAAVPVSPEVWEVITRALEISRLSAGAFDPTVGPLEELWNFSAAETPAEPPTAEALSRALAQVGWQKVKVDTAAGTVFLSQPGMRLDLGAVAKGWAVDRAILALKTPGVERALVNAGGDLRAFVRPGGKRWRIGLQDPRRPDSLLGEMEIENEAVATSGQYQRGFQINGRWFGHILDPRTGRPAEGTLSATAVAEECWKADAWATALFVLGPEQGWKVLSAAPGVEALVVSTDGQRHLTTGLAPRFRPASAE